MIFPVVSVLATNQICTCSHHNSITVKHHISFNHQRPHQLGFDIAVQEQLKLNLLLTVSILIVNHQSFVSTVLSCVCILHVCPLQINGECSNMADLHCFLHLACNHVEWIIVRHCIKRTLGFVFNPLHGVLGGESTFYWVWGVSRGLSKAPLVKRRGRSIRNQIKSDYRHCKFILILWGLVYSAHLKQIQLFLMGPRLEAWELDASLCVFLNTREMAVGRAQAVCLRAHCSLSARGRPALFPY